MLIDLIRDPEFERFLPEPGRETDQQLEEQLVRDGGPRDPICVWAGKKIILDGYRRHAICKKHDLPFAVEEVELPDREAAKLWMIRQQLMRRNLDAHQRSVLLSLAATSLGAKVTHGQKVGRGESGMYGAADSLGVEPRTLYRSVEYTEAFQSLPEDVQAWVAAEQPARKDVLDLAKVPSAEQQRDIVESIKQGEFTSLHEALFGEEQEGEEEYEPEPSPEPRQRKPSPKPLETRFQEVYDALGRVKSLLDKLSLDFAGPYYDISMGFLNQANDAIDAWKKTEEQ